MAQQIIAGSPNWFTNMQQTLSEIADSTLYRFDYFIDMIEENCQPYLSEIGGIEGALINYPLYRGLKHNPFTSAKPVIIESVSQNRKAVDMPVAFHAVIDDYFNHKFGIKFRSSSVFCTGDGLVADYFSGRMGNGGVTAIILPVDQYNYCWSPRIKDLYDRMTEVPGLVSYKSVQPTIATAEQTKQIIAVLEDGDYQFNTGLINAIQSQREIMISCQRVLMMKSAWRLSYLNHVMD